MGTRIGHVNFRVTDQDRSRDFFVKVLGMEVSEEDPEHGGVFMTFGEDFHNVDVSDARGGIPRSPRPPGLVHVAFAVDSMKELREAYLRLQEIGVEIHHAWTAPRERPTTCPSGSAKNANVRPKLGISVGGTSVLPPRLSALARYAAGSSTST